MDIVGVQPVLILTVIQQHAPMNRNKMMTHNFHLTHNSLFCIYTSHRASIFDEIS